MKVFHQLEDGFWMLTLQLSNGYLRDHSSGSCLLLVNCLDSLMSENLRFSGFGIFFTVMLQYLVSVSCS